MKKRFPLWTIGLVGILLLILVPVLYFLPRAQAENDPAAVHPRPSQFTWIIKTSSKANSKQDRM